jgi:two-component system NtrC family sensor kinase
VHKLLQRQLQRCFGADVPSDARFVAFARTVDSAYEEADKDRALLERSMNLASAELLERNVRLEQDLASIQRLELELRQAEKLRAVGQLAAGIAHEINTPVQFLGDSLRFLKQSFGELLALGERGRALCAAVAAGDEALTRLGEVQACAREIELEFLMSELPKAFEQTESGVRRVADIVVAMNEFGKSDPREKVPMALQRCIETALLMADYELKQAAEVELALDPLPLIPGYPGELQHVLLSLLLNAGHAIVDRFGTSRGGRIRVVATSAGEHVVVSVSDNGCGIAVEHRARIFEPFFTTKQVGRGSGQALAVARSIVVDKHAGTLTFESTEGKGTTFTLKLPMDGISS